MPRSAWNLAGLGALLAAITSCHGDATAPDTGGPFQVDVRVVDDAGHPLLSSAARATVWRADGIARLDERFTDSTGRVRWQDTLAEGAVVDSVTIWASAGGCEASGARRAAHLTRRWSDSLSATLTLHALPRVPLQAGTEYCGPGLGSFGGSPTPFWVSFLVESVGDTVRGKWEINYTESRRTDYGPFTGVAFAGEVRLQLRPDHLTGVCDMRADLVLMLDEAGAIESGHLKNDGGCVVYETLFEVTAYDDPYFP